MAQMGGGGFDMGQMMGMMGSMKGLMGGGGRKGKRGIAAELTAQSYGHCWPRAGVPGRPPVHFAVLEDSRPGANREGRNSQSITDLF